VGEKREFEIVRLYYSLVCRLLDMGFDTQIASILYKLPKQRRTVCNHR
jgi:hypothetical protein